MAEPNRITLQEAAERLGVHYMTAYRYVRLGRLRATQRDGRWYVRESDLEALRTADRRPKRAARRGTPVWKTYRNRLRARLRLLIGRGGICGSSVPCEGADRQAEQRRGPPAENVLRQAA